MDVQKQNEEKLREACCYGDNEAVLALVTQGTNINSQHEVNGWTALHWACKRGQADTVRLLMSHGADPELETNQGQRPANLTTDMHILKLLGAEAGGSNDSTTAAVTGASDSLPITPNYLANPPINYKVPLPARSTPVGVTVANGVPESNGHATAGPNAYQPLVGSQPNLPPSHIPLPGHPIAHSGPMNDAVARLSKELVLKVRLASTDDPDFIEVDLERSQLNYSYLLTTCCRELAVNPQLVERIRKLPNTRLRSDRDSQRLTDYTELELVTKGHARPSPKGDANTTSKNNYKSIHGFKNQTILY